MAFNWKTWTVSGLLMICWLMVPAVLVGEEGAVPETEALSDLASPDILKMFGEPNPESLGRDFAPPDGVAMPAPDTIRHYTYRDADAEPYCAELPADTWIRVFDESFVTDADTTYIELCYNGQFNVTGGANAFHGILYRAALVQDGVTIFFPGGGEGFTPYISRRDLGTNGQYMFSSYTGMLYVDPDTATRLIIKLKSTDLDGTACFQNIIVRND